MWFYFRETWSKFSQIYYRESLYLEAELDPAVNVDAAVIKGVNTDTKDWWLVIPSCKGGSVAQLLEIVFLQDRNYAAS